MQIHTCSSISGKMKERDHLLAKGGIWLAGNEEILLSISRHKRGWMMMVEYVLRSREGGCLQGEGKACPQGRFSAFFVKAQEIDDEKRRGLFLWQKYCNFIRKQSSTKNSSVLCRTRKERQIHLNGKDES